MRRSLLFLSWLAGSIPIAAQSTIRVSVDSLGAQGNANSLLPWISADGQSIAFLSFASNLVAGDANGFGDIFVHATPGATTTRASLGPGGAQTNGNNDNPSISADGRYVAFTGYGSNLVVGDTNGAWDIFVRDLLAGTTVRVNVDSTGNQANANSFSPVISADGRFVAFTSAATNLAGGDTNGSWEVFVHDVLTGSTERACVDSAGNQGDGNCDHAALSADGRFVAFIGYATNLVPGDTNGYGDVFVHDRVTGATLRASVDSSGNEAHGNCDWPSLSADGRYAAFTSYASDLVAGDTNGYGDILVRDLVAGTTERVSVASGGVEAHGNCDKASITADGRYVAFTSYADDLVAGDTNNFGDIFLHDRTTGTTTRESVDSAGSQAHGNCDKATISADGRFVAFVSYASDLVAGDTNGSGDVFVRDRGQQGFSPFCEPGTSGVMACACGNPNGPGAGCANTGSAGGSLSAAGIASLFADGLDPGAVTLTGTNMLSGSLCIFLQGNVLVASGAPFGAGIRCTGGSLKRLYVKSLVGTGGAKTAPEAADRSISNRSADLGDPIAVNSTRWYQTYYRDPSLPNPGGACPAIATFNVTSGQQIVWSP